MEIIRQKFFNAVFKLSKRSLFRPLLYSTLFKNLFAGYMARGCLTVTHDCLHAKPINVLAINDLRFGQDLAVLGSHEQVRVLKLDIGLVKKINFIFVPDDPGGPYYLVNDPRVLRQRQNLNGFALIFVGILKKHYDLHCAVSPGFHYKPEQEWIAACCELGIPFVALHKELTITNAEQVAERQQRFREKGGRFRGSEICVVNERAKEMLAGGGVFPAEKITVTGLMRTDKQFAMRSEKNYSPEKKSVVLFSFGHFTGGWEVTKPKRSKSFSKNDDEGYVALFRDVHVGVAELALERPEVEFYIKPKYLEEWMTSEIDAVIFQALGRHLADIPNLRIVDEPAPQLILRANVAIGLNSTVLIESLIIGTNTILPFFDEAPHYPKYVLLQDCFDLFAVARSMEDYKGKIRQGLDDARAFVSKDTELLSRCLMQYIGSDDGKARDRVVARLQHCIQAARHGSDTTN